MAATETFKGFGGGLVSPAENAFAITPHDTNQIAYMTRGLYVGGSGDVKVVTSGGDTVTFANLTAGVVHPLRVVQVFATGTAATGIIGVY